MPELQYDNRPNIGIILDEDTSNGGQNYQTRKEYFDAIWQAGGAPIALTYHETSKHLAIEKCAGLMSTGARIKFDDDYYVKGDKSEAPYSDRFEIERNLIQTFLDLNRPYFGICNGMQLLGALLGGKMTSRINALGNFQTLHNDAKTRHRVLVYENSKLLEICGKREFLVNSFHNEGLTQVLLPLKISARSEEGIIEAIESIAHDFVIGVQWHPELLWPKANEPSNIALQSQKLFEAFVNAAKKTAGL